MSAKLNQIEINEFMVPATFHDAILKVRDGWHKGKIAFAAGNHYQVSRDGKNVCDPIGYLFTATQRKQILALDGTVVDFYIGKEGGIWDRFGKRNMEAMLSMKQSDAADLQQTFDWYAMQVDAGDITGQEARDGFNEYLQACLSQPNYDNPAA